METKHTKGEWKVNIDSGRLSSDQSEVPLASIKIPLRDGLNQWDEMEENAKLIAAAPDLLTSLSNLVREVQVRHVSDSKDPLWVAAMEGLKIIKKATE